MTRGKLVLFTKDHVYATTEFNGDMYFEGHGEEAARLMLSVNTPGDLIEAAKKINKHFGYGDEFVLHLEDLTEKFTYYDLLDFTGDRYFEKYFSDYIFLKNASGRTLSFRGEHEFGTRKLASGKSGVTHFGETAYDFPAELDAFTAGRDAKNSGTEILTADEIEEINQKYSGRLAISAYPSWEDAAREKAVTDGAVVPGMEKYFNMPLYADDFRSGAGKDMLELSTGTVVRLGP